MRKWMFTELTEVSFHYVWKSNCYAEVLCVNYISIKLKEIGRKTIFIISKLLFAYPLILQKKERGKKKRRASQTLHLIMVPVSIFLLNTSSSHFDTHMANVKAASTSAP